MDIGQAIQTLRKTAGISQKELAEKAGISANALCAIEKDKSFPSKQTVRDICQALNIPAGLLLFSAITEEDIPEEKRPIFEALKEPILKLFR